MAGIAKNHSMTTMTRVMAAKTTVAPSPPMVGRLAPRRQNRRQNHAVHLVDPFVLKNRGLLGNDHSISRPTAKPGKMAKMGQLCGYYQEG